MTLIVNNATAAPGAAVVCEIGVLQDALSLKRNQAETLYHLMRLSAPGAVEKVCLAFNETGVYLKEVRRVRSSSGTLEKCELGHPIAYAYDIGCQSNFNGQGEEVHTLGSVCASHVLNLPPSVARAIEGLSRWTRRLEDKEFPELIAGMRDRLKALSVPEGQLGQRMIDDYRASAEYAEVVEGIRKLKGRELEAAQYATTDRRRQFNVARLCHAIRTVEVCIEGELPFTRTLVTRIKRGVSRLAFVNTQRRQQPIPTTATIPTVAPGIAATPSIPLASQIPASAPVSLSSVQGVTQPASIQASSSGSLETVTEMRAAGPTGVSGLLFV